MELELGRPVTVAVVYQKNKEAKLTELEAETEEDSDGTSLRRGLSLDEDNTVFLHSTFVNERGHQYGVGSLESVVSGKRKYPGSSSSFSDLQQQLEEAQRKIEEKTAFNTKLQEESARVAVAQQSKINHLTLVEKYLTQTDPTFLDFIASQTADLATSKDPEAQETGTTLPLL